jgi:hypothetical protein
MSQQQKQQQQQQQKHASPVGGDGKTAEAIGNTQPSPVDREDIQNKKGL